MFINFQSAKDRDRAKINRLPADAKRAPDLPLHSPCAFAQTMSKIYTNPFSDLAKAKESSPTTGADGALDLSRTRQHRNLPPPASTSGLNLKKESALKQHLHDLTGMKKHTAEPVKVSPFSAEALLSKPTAPKTAPPPPPPPLAAAVSKSNDAPPRASPSNYPPGQPRGGASSMFPSSASSSDKSRTSPWHTPVTTAVRPVNTAATSAHGGQKFPFLAH